jgi:hypothetical protein
MKQIIKLILIKAGQIILPIFLIVLGITIGVLPVILTAVNLNGWYMAGLIITVPITIALISIVNNFAEWDDIFDFYDIDEAQRLYKNKKKRKVRADKWVKDQSIANNNYQEPGVEYKTDRM